MLTQLAWVEFICPKFCVFENVPRFLFTELHNKATGTAVHSGYIKFLVSALVKLGYGAPCADAYFIFTD
jgi:site-specific DNA-cytosine methylase